MSVSRRRTTTVVVPVVAALLVSTWLAALFRGATPGKAAEMLGDGWPVLGLLALFYVLGSILVVRGPRRWSTGELWAMALVPLLGTAVWVAVALAAGRVPASALAATTLAWLTGAAAGIGVRLLPRRHLRSLDALLLGLLTAGLTAAGIAAAAELLLLIPRLVPDLSTGIVLPTATQAERIANSHAAVEDAYVGSLAFGGLLLAAAGATAFARGRAPGRPQPTVILVSR